MKDSTNGGTTVSQRVTGAVRPPKPWASLVAVARRAFRFPDVVMSGLLAAFGATRVLILFRGTVFTSADTASYSYRANPALNRGPLVSLTGHAPRLWGSPLLYALFPDDTTRALAQWGLSTLAWLLLALVVWRLLSSLPGRILAAGGVLTLGLLPQVTNWDFAILSESLSITLGVLTLALLLHWLATGSRSALVTLVVAAVWWTFIRPEIRLMVAIVAAVLVVRAFRHGAGRRSAAAAATLLVIAMTWVSLITPAMSRTFAERSRNGLSLEQSTLVYRLRFQVMAQPAVMAVYKKRLGMPDCAEAERIAAARPWRTSRFFAAYQSSPELAQWGARNATAAGYRFAVAAPGLYARQTLRLLPAALQGGVYAQGARILPTAVERAAFPSRSLVLPLLLGGIAVVAAVGLAVRAHRRRPLLTGSAVLLSMSSLVSAVAGFMYSAGEDRRFGIQEAIGLRLGLLLLAAAVLDSIFELVRDRRNGMGVAP